MDPTVASTSSGNATAPLAFMVAAWLGMPSDDILRGLAEGWIAAPPGSPPGWTPPWLDGATGTSGDPDWGHANDSAGGAAIEEDPQNSIVDQEPAIPPSRSTVEGWLRAIDPALANDALERLWQLSGGEDAARGAWWRDYLQRSCRTDGTTSIESSAHRDEGDTQRRAARDLAARCRLAT